MTPRGSAALPAALVALAVTAALTAALVDLAGTELAVARHRRDAAVALAVTDGCLATVVADAPAGWDFAPLLAGPDGRAGTPDDGLLATPATCAGRAAPAPGPAVPPRALLTLEGAAGRGHRLVAAVVGREPAAGVPAVLWLDATPAMGSVPGTLTLDGTDGLDPLAPGWAAVAAPADPLALDAWLAGDVPHVALATGTAPPIHAPTPPFAELTERLRAAPHGGAETLVTSTGPPPALALVDADLVVADDRHGAGLLVVVGRLDIRAALHFTGVVVASGGIRVASGGMLAVAGAVWSGLPLALDGDAAIRRATLDDADRLLPLPRRAVLLSMRDLG